MSIPAESMASADRPKKRQRSFLSNLVFWGTVSIFGVIILLMSVVPLTLGAYDDNHRDRIECNVTDAKGDDNNPMGRRSWSTPDVTISTSDCGTLLYVPGSGEAANDAIAAELAEGGRFSFEMGQATRALQGVFDAIGMTPEVLSYQKID
ncbi:hypothetical protein KKR91_07755 [Arthrobacter jiangjiafuii]|uniref:Uncharacterized protein n=1 Tax=Arthrobacter jiangjiafuii TaxID=2817475 RepID=A0A975R1M2_9MICC|nr:hypothetical protein [Arthrobacter jiangjiafuii]MBP3042900.1 hypothetical protein [Arthrobacter jiangjiafuii]QWC11432.1 hypothetical protein KKR91_07755 [Arthrobacter jiangjiafuii]